MAVSTLLGWWAGGRLFLAVLWVGLAVWMYLRPVAPNVAYDAVVRGWSLMLAASFGIVSLAAPRLRLFARAMTTVVVAFAMVGVVLVARPGTIDRFGDTLGDEMRRRSNVASGEWTKLTATPQWKEFEGENQAVIDFSAQVSEFWRRAPDFTSPVAAALLAIESLAALSLVWGLYHRASRARLGPPLGALRDFRFNDQLVWGLIAGVTFVALPNLASLRGVGINLLVFFGTLYLLRGLGVLTWFLAPRRIALALLIVVAVLSWPIIGIFSLGLGLGDTWFDLRGRARTTS